MKTKIFRKLLVYFFLALISSYSAFTAGIRTLVSEYGYIESQKGIFYEFTVPENAVMIKIECSTSMEYTSKMIFGVCSSESDARQFYSRGRYHCHPGTYEVNAQGYIIRLEDLLPGKTYYFVAYNDSYGILSASEYEIETEISALVHSGWLGVTCSDIEAYYNYDYRALVKDKLFVSGPYGYEPTIRGVAVAHVMPGSPADSCGLKMDDIIVVIDGVNVDMSNFLDIMNETVVNQIITVGIRRFENDDWTYKTVRCQLSEVPSGFWPAF